MKQIEIIFTKKYEPVFTKIEKQMTWYDPIKKETLNFFGGKLEFEYRHDDYLEEMGVVNTYRSLPKVVELKERRMIQKSNKEKIMDWFNENYNRHVIFINYFDDNSFVVDIANDEYDDFVSELYRQRFDYREI